jgi:hypothetical protein
MRAAVRVLWCVLMVGLFVFSLGCWVVASSASADEPAPVYSPSPSPLEPGEGSEAPACPEGPGVYEGEDASVDAVYGLAADLVQECRVLRFGLGQVRRRVWWSVLESLSSQSLQREGDQLLTRLVEAPSSAGEPVDVSELASLDESGFLSLRFVLWFIAAVLVAGLAAYALVRLVVFRDN